MVLPFVGALSSVRWLPVAGAAALCLSLVAVGWFARGERVQANYAKDLRDAMERQAEDLGRQVKAFEEANERRQEIARAGDRAASQIETITRDSLLRLEGFDLPGSCVLTDDARRVWNSETARLNALSGPPGRRSD